MPTHRDQERAAARFVVVATMLAALVVTATALVAQGRREFDVTARRYAFSVAGSTVPELHVTQNDLVHVTFRTEDIPHSFTIDESPYRIMRRAEPGKPVAFDFRADQPGRFEITCSLTADSGCRDMHAVLVVDRAR